jgi:SAM-dependent methyltransferase
MQRFRGRSSADPFIPTTVYDLRDAIEAIDRAWRDANGLAMNLALIQVERQPALTSAIAFVQAPSLETQQRQSPARKTDQSIDVKDVIASTPPEALIESAEEYFASLPSWDYYLAKPFSSADAAPGLLYDLAQVLRCLEPAPGLRVLDFGSGTGWVSRCLTQLGCRTVLLDVSATALRIAQELYARHPVVGEHAAPDFLTFDGRRIPLPDASVDRILCFHSFHHVPDPALMLQEFSRVLTNDGRAVFAEPGPRHSRHASSQFEMRTHRVVENDIDIHQLWRDAQACGFTDIRMVIGHEPLFQVSLEEFEELLAAGKPASKWLDSTRDYLRASRTFVLFRGTQADADSSSSTGLSCRLTVAGPPAIAGARQQVGLDVTVENTGTATWLPADVPHGGVMVGAHLYDSDGRLLQFDFGVEGVAGRVPPGGRVTVRLTLPPLGAGRYVVEIDCVARQVGWFSQWGSATQQFRLDVTDG